MSDFDPHQFRDEWTDVIHRRIRRRRDRFHHRRHSRPGGIIVGTTILLVGVLFLLQNFGLVQAARVWQYWPVVVIAWGIAGATNSRHAGGRVWGGVIVIAGTVLLLGNLHIISDNIWRVLWPLFLIGVGLSMLYRTARRRRRREEDHFPEGPPPAGQTPAGGPAAPSRVS